MSLGCREELNRLIRERILILDGAMGSAVQGYHLSEEDFRGKVFARHPLPLLGCNDVLCLSKPELITAIHDSYLEAGADIISSCSFNASAVSLADYGLEHFAYDINRAAGALAREAADRFSSPGRPRFAAGSMGPTAKSGSISPDMNDPTRRGVTWDELEAAYYDNARGLLDGGVHLLLLETVFDTLNAKAAIAAVIRLREERGEDIPLMISATVSDASGRLLSGQTLEAFAVSVSHARPLSLGVNCSLGAEKILPHLEALSAFSSLPVSCHPNAGLPDRFGSYSEGPEETAGFMRIFFEKSLVNIAGGCCGTGPAHIAAIARLAQHYSPRPCGCFSGPAESAPSTEHIPSGERYPLRERGTFLAGLEVLPLPVPGEGRDFIDIGERTNVAGSRKFLRLIQNGAWEEAAGIAREMIAAGARITDVCMDDALLDSKAAMVHFLHTALSDPEIARFPVMPDSSRWETLEAALKCIQGKSLVNSLSLKEGEAELLRRAALIRRYGAAAVVMLFDESGQAQSYERKIEIAERSFRLLTAAGFPAEDIVFDPNVLTIATGMAGHDRYALDFIRACAWIREHCPGARISAGLSNLSFSFRGNETIRSALHAVFLKHAVEAGLSMAILNPAGLVSCDDISPALREAAEDAVLCRGGTAEDYAERLMAAAALSGSGANGSETAGTGDHELEARPPDADAGLSLEERIARDLVKGIDKDITGNVLELFSRGKTSLEIVEGPLMRGMEETGRLFGEGKLFLPQVIRSARVMKKAVAALEAHTELNPNSAADPAGNTVRSGATAGTIVIATVKGDVHDIGKNIAALVLGCNGYRIIDLGVMVPAPAILEAARNAGADCVGLSGLISPSLDEMIRVAEAMEKGGFTIPLLIGGAAASLAHTALRIAPAYSGPVVYVRDAGETPQAVRALLSPRYKAAFLEQLAGRYEEARMLHHSIAGKRSFLTLEAARANRFSLDWDTAPLPPPPYFGLVQYDNYPVEKIIPRIDWDSFCRRWELEKASSGYTLAAEELTAAAKTLLERIAGTVSLRAVVGFFPALSENEDIILYAPAVSTEPQKNSPGKGPQKIPLGSEIAQFCFLRNQETKPHSIQNLCLADFILPREKSISGGNQRYDRLGLFALTAELNDPDTAGIDSYDSLLASTLTHSLAEAFSEELHRKICAGAVPAGTVLPEAPGIRPAFGYPACPDHQDKKTALKLLEARERIGLAITETGMIIPSSSICGMYITRPEASYFGAGVIAEDQLTSWAQRKGITIGEARRRTGRI